MNLSSYAERQVERRAVSVTARPGVVRVVATEVGITGGSGGKAERSSLRCGSLELA